jgi:hypothetical protein
MQAATEPKIYEMHVKPTYAVVIPQRTRTGSKTLAQRENEKNLRANQLRGVMSKKAISRMKNAINWMVASAQQKTIFDKETKKRYSFKVNFITLTLPTTQHNCTDHYFKSVLLHNFINTCRYRYGLKNYIWKVETQQNGNIHAHFTTDTFIHWRDLRDVWNTILSKNGLIDAYTQKHEKLSFKQYCKLYNSDGSKTIEQLRKSFDFGVSTSWQSPNSTDVHAVHNVENLAGYLSKYMSKKEEGRRLIKGRVWGCSYNLSEKNKLVLEMVGNEDVDLFRELCKQQIEYKQLTAVNKLSKQAFLVGEIFFYKMHYWGTVIKGRLLEKYNNHRFSIRQALDENWDKAITVVGFEQPLTYSLVTPNNRLIPPNYNKLF